MFREDAEGGGRLRGCRMGKICEEHRGDLRVVGEIAELVEEDGRGGVGGRERRLREGAEGLGKRGGGSGGGEGLEEGAAADWVIGSMRVALRKRLGNFDRSPTLPQRLKPHGLDGMMAEKSAPSKQNVCSSTAAWKSTHPGLKSETLRQAQGRLWGTRFVVCGTASRY